MLQQAALTPKTNMLQYFSECVQWYSQNVCEQMPLPASDPTSSNNCLFQGVVCACIHVCIPAINLYLFNSWAKLVSKYLKYHLKTWQWPCELCNSNQAPPLPPLLTVAHWPRFVIHCAGLLYCGKNSNNKTYLNQDRTSSWSQNIWSLTSFICILPLQCWCFLFYVWRLPLPP